MVAASRADPNHFAQLLFRSLPRRYDRLARVLSLGQDLRWRSTMLDHVCGSRANLILDVACGPGAVTKSLIKRTSAKIVGLDLSEEMLRAAQHNAAARGYSDRVALVLARGERLPFADSTFDALTFTYLLRYVSDPKATMAELARVVKPGGPIANLEFAVPRGAGVRLAWWVYTRGVLPVAGYALGGRSWWTVGRFLGPSISKHYARFPLDWTVEAWRDAGIEHVEYQSMSLGGGLVMWGYRGR